MTNFWTNEEQSIIESGKSFEDLKRLLPNRSEGAIKSRLRKLEQPTTQKEKTDRHTWTNEELAILGSLQSKEVDKETLDSVIKRLPHITDSGKIWRKMKSLGFVWVKEEVEQAVVETKIGVPINNYAALVSSVLLGQTSKKDIHGLDESKFDSMYSTEVKNYQDYTSQTGTPTPSQYAAFLNSRYTSVSFLRSPIPEEFELLGKDKPSQADNTKYITALLTRINYALESDKLAEVIKELKNG
jgi:hypothetical protein